MIVSSRGRWKTLELAPDIKNFWIESIQVKGTSEKISAKVDDEIDDLFNSNDDDVSGSRPGDDDDIDDLFNSNDDDPSDRVPATTTLTIFSSRCTWAAATSFPRRAGISDERIFE